MDVAVTSLVQDSEVMEVKNGQQSLSNPERPSSLHAKNHPPGRGGKTCVEQEHAHRDSNPVREGQLISPNQVLRFSHPRSHSNAFAGSAIPVYTERQAEPPVPPRLGRNQLGSIRFARRAGVQGFV